MELIKTKVSKVYSFSIEEIVEALKIEGKITNLFIENSQVSMYAGQEGKLIIETID